MPPQIIIAVAGNVTHDAGGGAVRRAASTASRGRPGRAAERAAALRARREHRAQAARAGAPGDGLPGPGARRPRALRAVPAQRRHRRQHVLAPVPGGAGAAGAGVLDPLRRPGLPRHRARCTSTPPPTPTTSRKVLKSILKELREREEARRDRRTSCARAKDHLKGSLMLSLESTSSRMNRLAKHELHLGSFLTMDAMLASIDGVRHEEVQALVSRGPRRGPARAHHARPARPPEPPSGAAGSSEGSCVPLRRASHALRGATRASRSRPAWFVRRSSPRSTPPTCSGRRGSGLPLGGVLH